MKNLVKTTLGLLLMSSQLVAQTPDRPVGIKRPDVVKRWQETMWRAEQDLQAGDWKKARRTAQSVLSEMFDGIEGGEGVASLLAAATFLRAVSEAGLGNEEAAAWDYVVAQTLLPDLSQADLGSYQAAGKLLESWRLSGESIKEATSGVLSLPKVPKKGSKQKGEAVDSSTQDELIPPQKITAPGPLFPFGKIDACVEGPIFVQVIIDKRGVPKRPLLLSDQEPLLGYAALEALRDWRFEPARLKGEPVEVYYNLQVNFELRKCAGGQKRDGG